MGFEPTCAEHNELAVHHLNQVSATLSFINLLEFSMVFDSNKNSIPDFYNLYQKICVLGSF